MGALSKDRAQRLLAIIYHLRAQAPQCAKTLGNRLGVTTRTILRDVFFLQELGVEIDGMVGRRGGYRLATQDVIKPLLLSRDDSVFLVFAAILFGEASANLAVFPAVVSGLSSLEREALALARKRIHLAAVAKNPECTHFSAIRNALFGNEQLRLKVEERSGGLQSWIAIHPYGLIAVNRRWHLIGQCGPMIVSVRLDRVRKVVSTGMRFRFPAGFNAKDWWTSYAAGKQSCRVVLRARGILLHEVIGINTALSASRGLEITIYADHWQQLVPFVLSCGPAVTVEHPAELRAAIAAAAAAMVNQYEGEAIALEPLVQGREVVRAIG
jgi:predicted DNA-binding transcriptional regulator YafY